MDVATRGHMASNDGYGDAGFLEGIHSGRGFMHSRRRTGRHL